MIKIIPEGVRGCVSCGEMYQTHKCAALSDHRCEKCSPLGHPTPEIREHIEPFINYRKMTWKSLILLMRRYSIHFKDLSSILQKQKNFCGKCGELMVKFCVDHDHACCQKPPTCGKCTRGLICYPCNQYMAGYDHYVSHKREVERYIEQYQETRKRKIGS